MLVVYTMKSRWKYAQYALTAFRREFGRDSTGTYSSSEQRSGFSMRYPARRKSKSFSIRASDGYGVPPSVIISQRRTPKDQLKAKPHRH